MKIENKLIQQRPSLAVEFFNASDEFKQLKQDYVSQGKLTDIGASFSNDNLTKTWTLIFSTEEDYISFKSEAFSIEYINHMQEYNAVNQISFSIEQRNI